MLEGQNPKKGACRIVMLPWFDRSIKEKIFRTSLSGVISLSALFLKSAAVSLAPQYYSEATFDISSGVASLTSTIFISK